MLVAVNLAALAAAVFAGDGWAPAIDRFVRAAAFVEPVLLSCLLVLYAASPWLARLPYWQGCLAAMAVALAVAAGLELFMAGDAAGLGRVLVLAAASCAALLAYFRLFAKAYSPALADARLQALQARIRPHFLFNSLNAVLSLIRRDPKRAERALEDLADLFRTLMSDARQFTRLADEIALLERYASLEQLRLGERLRITWELDAAPSDALLPPLVLQPLLENAVYHGIEPRAEGGVLRLRGRCDADACEVRIENPLAPPGGAREGGNRMALDNIRERLRAFFGREGLLAAAEQGGAFVVTLTLPRERA